MVTPPVLVNARAFLKEEASSKAISVPLNKTPPAPPEKTTTANFTESWDEIFVSVQAEGRPSRDEKDEK
ncbi:hypothetical protein [Microcoleus asticus]|uniref:Uncharacterized protein n=1 Tax=Microcoleus asticus IPMA8 TaxID=2563858 RepID=A0ABX2CXR9_9CYAN|nr:hypothetical protein [Microcoleus asticus]NQE35185.1 hypothetical protein [Microcoleus asticus IPMA8]